MDVQGVQPAVFVRSKPCEGENFEHICLVLVVSTGNSASRSFEPESSGSESTWIADSNDMALASSVLDQKNFREDEYR
jgi:hypothetical protein